MASHNIVAIMSVSESKTQTNALKTPLIVEHGPVSYVISFYSLGNWAGSCVVVEWVEMAQCFALNPPQAVLI
jgi:hypothetical protein